VQKDPDWKETLKMIVEETLYVTISLPHSMSITFIPSLPIAKEDQVDIEILNI